MSVSPFELSPSGFVSVPRLLLFPPTKIVSVLPRSHFVLFPESGDLFFITGSEAKPLSFLQQRDILNYFGTPVTFFFRTSVLLQSLKVNIFKCSDYCGGVWPVHKNKNQLSC